MALTKAQLRLLRMLDGDCRRVEPPFRWDMVALIRDGDIQEFKMSTVVSVRNAGLIDSNGLTDAGRAALAQRDAGDADE